MKAPWLAAAGFPERVALIHMFTAKFHQRFPTEGPIRGTSRVWLMKTVKSSAAEIEYRLGNPEGIATLISIEASTP